MIEIPENTYRPEEDPEVGKVSARVVEKLKEANDVCIYREYAANGENIVAPKHIAMEVGKRFSRAGYYVYLCEFTTGCFNFLEISKRPVDTYHAVRRI